MNAQGENSESRRDSPAEDGGKRVLYTINKIDHDLQINCNKEKIEWRDCPAIEVGCDNGWKMNHRPHTIARLLYSKKYLYVRFDVKDRFVRCVADQINGEVWKDSCAEFFFIPGSNLSTGYFNLEVNCGGTIRMGYQETPRGTPYLITQEDAKEIKLYHSLPSVIEHEIVQPIEWTIEISLPFNILCHFAEVEPPVSGDSWKANFYKCAESNSHPHWLSWKHIDSPSPDFHLPKFFGEVKFG